MRFIIFGDLKGTNLKGRDWDRGVECETRCRIEMICIQKLPRYLKIVSFLKYLPLMVFLANIYLGGKDCECSHENVFLCFFMFSSLFEQVVEWRNCFVLLRNIKHFLLTFVICLSHCLSISAGEEKWGRFSSFSLDTTWFIGVPGVKSLEMKKKGQQVAYRTAVHLKIEWMKLCVQGAKLENILTFRDTRDSQG